VLLSNDDPSQAANEAAKVLAKAFEDALLKAINDASGDVPFQDALSRA
jgi:hypothetical protein